MHGGAWDIPGDRADDCRAGVRRALEAGWQTLESGGSASDAVERAVLVLEDETVFDAGIGSHLNRDGHVQLDAVLMDGKTLKSGAVAAVERIRNPITVARRVCEQSPHMLLVGQGAEQFAVEQRFNLCDPSELVIARESERWLRARGRGDREPAPSYGDTVGAVALDAGGNLASGTSTGGTPGKYPGRVGDSPLVGCGCYADNRVGAASCTGQGEAIMKVVLAKFACDRMGEGLDPQSVAERAAAYLHKRTGERGGLILIDRQGRVGSAFNTPHMAFACQVTGADPIISL